MKRNQKDKGITLVALVVTIIILIILALVTIQGTIGQNGLITKARELRNYMDNAIIADEEAINQLLEEIEEMPEPDPEPKPEPVQYTPSIDINLASHNTRDIAQFVFSVKGNYNGETVYDNIETCVFTAPGTKTINLDINVPKGTELTVTEVYSAANYKIDSSKEVKKTLGNDANTTFNFSNSYDYKVITTTGLSTSLEYSEDNGWEATTTDVKNF